MFKVGEIAIFCNARYNSELNGLEVTINRPLMYRDNFKDNQPGELCYGITGIKEVTTALPSQLKKLGSGNKIVDWSDCIWQPTTIKELI